MTTFFWTKYPFVRVGIAFILGIFLAYYIIDLPDFKWSTHQWETLCYGLALLLIMTIQQSFIAIKPNLFVVLVLFFLIGLLRFLLEDPRTRHGHISEQNEKYIEAILGHVTTEPEIKNERNTFTISIDSVFFHKKWHAGKGLVKTTLNNRGHYSLGECLVIKGDLNTIHRVETPFDFNYAASLAYQKTYYTLYSNSSYSVPSHSSYEIITSIKRMAIQCRTSIESVITHAIKNTFYQNIIIGLLTGKRTNLSTEDRSLFTNSGTIHILAISGMHIVLIYQVMVFFLFHSSINKNNPLANLLILCLIWFYIFITGLNASAVRAGIMISIVLIGKVVHKHPQHINSLFATALIMLLYNPYYIADIGFCLSFLAIIGILLSSGIQFHHQGIKQYLLQSSTISIAAQATTLPLSVFLFQQFPVYFLLANLIVVPLSTLLLFSAIGLVCFHSLPYLSNVLIGLINVSCDVLFYTLSGINRLPYALLNHISLSVLEMIFIYLLFLSIIMAIYSKQKYWLWICTTVSIVLMSSIQMHMIHAYKSHSLLISGHKKSRQYVFIQGIHAYILKDALQHPNTFATEKFLSQHFVQKTIEIKLPQKDNFRLNLGPQSYSIGRKEDFNSVINVKKTTCCIIDYKNKYSYLPTKELIKDTTLVYSDGKQTTYIKRLSL